MIRGVKDPQQHRVQDVVVQDRAEDEAQYGIEDICMVQRQMEHQHLIQIVPLQKLQELGREMRNHRIFYVDTEKCMVPQFHLMISP